MKKRILSMLLAVLMIVSILPMGAFADPDPTYVAKIGETMYETLEAAIAAAE